MGSDRQLLALLSYLCVAAALGPSLAELPTSTRLFLLVGFCGGLVADWRSWRLPPWLLTLAALLGTVLALSRFSWGNPVASFLNVTAILLAIRLLAEKNRRTYLQLFGLAFFALAAASVIRLDLVYALAMTTLLTSGMVALVVLTAQELPGATACPPSVLRRLVGIGLLLTTAAVPLLIGFFLLLPRTQTPLWQGGVASANSTGFSEQVQPGKSSSQQLSQRMAFRAEVPGPLTTTQLYWRVTVLNHFTGIRWERVSPPPGIEPLTGTTTNEINQTIYLEPGQGRYLVGLDLPVTVTGQRLTMAPDSVLTSGRAGLNRIRYQVLSRPLATKGAPRSIAPEYLHLPANAPPRLAALGKEIRQQLSDPAARLQRVEALFHQQQLQYATTGMATAPTAVDDFFFAVKRGNCEFFASSAAILLRAAGIPVRLVGGYLGGDFSELGSFYTVSDERAHVWIEALVAGQWQRVDPSRWAINGAELGQSPPRSLAARLAALTNLVDYFWTRSVISYDFEQQLASVDRLSQTLSSMRQPAIIGHWLTWGGSGLAVLAGIWTLLHWRRPSREDRLLRTFARRLSLKKLPPTVCLLELARQSSDRRLQRAFHHYAATVYRGQRLSPCRYRRLRRLLSH